MKQKFFCRFCWEQTEKIEQAKMVARWVFGKMQERGEDIETKFFDVRDFDLPRDHYGTSIGEQFPEWRDAIIRADGLVIVTPEYNHGYPGNLKSFWICF